MFSLHDKVCVITGAAGGMGSATARRFAAAGAKVVLGDLADASALAAETGGIYRKTDVSEEKDIEALMQAAADAHGRIEVVINNAGAAFGGKRVDEASRRAYLDAFDTHAMAAAFGIKYGAAHMQDGGSIISTASLAGLVGMYGSGPYSASKFAVVGITKTAALELAPRNIRVNCICPGNIDTAMGAPPELLAITNAMTPLNRPGRPEEIAALFHFLASDDAAYITGQAIVIDGGMSAGPHLHIGDLLRAATKQ